MIKFYCDWCKQETMSPHGGNFGRRIELKLPDHSPGRMNVCVNFEFNEHKPEHLCRACYVGKIKQAAVVLFEEQND